jgi:hypothetical protein
MPVYRINNKIVLFIHVPKTGGTTVETFLSSHSSTSLHNAGVKLLRPVANARLTRSLPLQHFHAELLEGIFAPDFFDYAFIIVRDPMERMKSEYRHSRELKRLETRLPFDQWLTLILGLASMVPNLRHNHYRPQADFLCFKAEIFRFEDGMENIVGRLAARLGLPRPDAIPHKRRTEKIPIRISAASRARVRRIFASDYETFEY